MSIMVGGTRSLESLAVLDVVDAIIRDLPPLFSFVVGDASGVDSAFIRAFIRNRRRFQVFCVGQPPARLRRVVAPHAFVPLAGKGLPVRQALAVRTKRVAAEASMGMFVISHAGSRGSLLAVSQLISDGKEAFVYCVGFSEAPALPRGVSGSWLALGSFAGAFVYQFVRS